MGRGRPVHSQIRQNMIEVLHVKGSAYGYEIYKIYRELFPHVTLRVMYYHLKKGVKLHEFKIERVSKESGAYSWGTTVEKIYYSLGDAAKPKGDKRIREFLDRPIKTRRTEATH